MTLCTKPLAARQQFLYSLYQLGFFHWEADPTEPCSLPSAHGLTCVCARTCVCKPASASISQYFHALGFLLTATRTCCRTILSRECILELSNSPVFFFSWIPCENVGHLNSCSFSKHVPFLKNGYCQECIPRDDEKAVKATSLPNSKLPADSSLVCMETLSWWWLSCVVYISNVHLFMTIEKNPSRLHSSTQ